jgi:hypothetical protein
MMENDGISRDAFISCGIHPEWWYSTFTIRATAGLIIDDNGRIQFFTQSPPIPVLQERRPTKVYKALLVKGFIYISYVEVVANLNSLYKLSETDAVLHTPTGYSRVEVGSEHPINDSKQSLLPMGLCVPPCDACLEYIDLEMEKTTPDLMQSTNTLVSGLQFGDNKFMNV